MTTNPGPWTDQDCRDFKKVLAMWAAMILAGLLIFAMLSGCAGDLVCGLSGVFGNEDDRGKCDPPKLIYSMAVEYEPQSVMPFIKAAPP